MYQKTRSLIEAWAISSSIRAMVNTEMEKSSERYQCQHEYLENTWKCRKCGYEIVPELMGKIAETGSGRIMSTNV